MENIKTGGSENGFTFNVGSDESIGMPEQKFGSPLGFSTGAMRRGKQAEIFNNNGSSNKGEAGGVTNNNSEYGPVTFGF
jgi:hypothetical protein